MTNQATIFLVDDDEAVLDALRTSLMLDGFNVESYASGADFLAAYRGNRPGCLLMDLHMPTMDGLAVQLELLKRNIRLPIIFISGHWMPLDEITALKAGAVNFLDKPFRRSALLENIQTALKLMSARTTR
ncbi:response regulator transcription factor [Methylomicrobium lacus]|uniref:response regulator transcription factor n=1 Tax=Methylomicrobium lacus TaxID=136992 RepID=UPI0035A87FE7